jgi:hypothetical protein
MFIASIFFSVTGSTEIGAAYNAAGWVIFALKGRDDER